MLPCHVVRRHRVRCSDHGEFGSAFAVKSMAAGTPWTGTWSASPESGGPSFSQQTLRQIVHTSIGGTSAQVQVSNVFGTTPLVIADVHVALRSSGSAIVSGTSHTVTFGGQASITIPAGGLAVSDAVAMSVPALSDVAVSMYLPQSTGSSTYHQQGTATNYIASGDVSGNGSLPGAQTTGSYFFLANLNVQNTAAQGAVVTLGASITDGYASTTDANERWPNDLAVRLANSGRTIGVLNQGISGNRLLADGAGQSALNRFNRDVLSQPGVRWVIFSDDPINDLGSTSPPPTSAQLIAGVQQLIAMAHQNGIEFLCSTLTPYQGAGYWTQQGETAREAYNAYVLGSGSGCDGVIDQAAAVSNPSDPTMYLPAYDSGDHLHPGDAGYRASRQRGEPEPARRRRRATRAIQRRRSTMRDRRRGAPARCRVTSTATTTASAGRALRTNVGEMRPSGNGQLLRQQLHRPDGVDLEGLRRRRCQCGPDHRHVRLDRHRRQLVSGTATTRPPPGPTPSACTAGLAQSGVTDRLRTGRPAPPAPACSGERHQRPPTRTGRATPLMPRPVTSPPPSPLPASGGKTLASVTIDQDNGATAGPSASSRLRHGHHWRRHLREFVRRDRGRGPGHGAGRQL